MANLTASIAELQTQDMLNVIADCPVTFTHNGTDYEGTMGALISAEKLESGGFLQEPDLSVTTTLSVFDANGAMTDRFATVPALGEKITIDSVEYRIERIIKDEFNVAIQFDLVTPHK